MLLAGGVFAARRSKADVARIDPLRTDSKIILQRREDGVGLIDAESPADRKFPQRGIGKLDIDVGIPADIGEHFRQRLPGIDQLALPPGQLAAQFGVGHDFRAFDFLPEHNVLPRDNNAQAFRVIGDLAFTPGRGYLNAAFCDAHANQAFAYTVKGRDLSCTTSK